MTVNTETFDHKIDSPEAGVEQYPPRVYSLPVVSIVVINYNYGAYVEKAVESAMAQTYPLTECIVIDDCSTDDSAAIVDRLGAKYPNLKVVKNERNVGQSMSFRRGMAESTGSHLIFVDADDFLLPTCAEIHVMAHLSLRIPIGLTSVGMLQISGDHVITAAFPCFDEFIRANKSADRDYIRYLDLRPEVAHPALNAEQLKAAVYYVHPINARYWPWSPTSGNCFRRDALNLIMNNENLESLRVATDSYTLRGVTALTGCALIDVPLVGYRLHGGNDFQKTGNLHRVLSYTNDILRDRSNKAMKVLIDHMVDIGPDLVRRVEAPVFYLEALDSFDEVRPPILDGGKSYVKERLLAERKRLRDAIGAEDYDRWLAPRLLPPGICQQPLVKAILQSLIANWILPFMFQREDRRSDRVVKGRS